MSLRTAVGAIAPGELRRKKNGGPSMTVHPEAV